MPESDRGEFLLAHFEAAAEVFRLTGPACRESLPAAARLVEESLRRGGKLLLCGNGGSAADCQHMASELVGRLSHDVTRPGLAAVALTSDTSSLTALANDFGFEAVFARQVEAVGRKGDVLLAYSTSGNSPNILRALRQARGAGLGTILFSGGTGGEARTLTDIAVLVPSTDTQHIQEGHAALGHVLGALVERGLSGKAP